MDEPSSTRSNRGPKISMPYFEECSEQQPPTGKVWLKYTCIHANPLLELLISLQPISCDDSMMMMMMMMIVWCEMNYARRSQNGHPYKICSDSRSKICTALINGSIFRVKYATARKQCYIRVQILASWDAQIHAL